MSDTALTAELRAKVAAMTPGKIRPWDTKTGGSHLEIIPPNEREFHLRLYVACWLKDADAEAIAAVMNAAPALLDAADEVATLRAELERLNADPDYTKVYDALGRCGEDGCPCHVSASAKVAEQRIAALEAENAKLRDELTRARDAAAQSWKMTVHAIEDERDAALAERDAYKRAKSENDERFMLERDEARADNVTLRAAWSKENDEICQVLGKALGMPWYKDDQKNFPGATEANGVCVGEHVAVTIAMEAASRIAAIEACNSTLRAERDALEDERDANAKSHAQIHEAAIRHRKELEAENAKLRDELAAARADDTQVSRLLAWLRDPERKEPGLAFTAGVLREAADVFYAMQHIVDEHTSGAEMLRARAAELEAERERAVQEEREALVAVFRESASHAQDQYHRSGLADHRAFYDGRRVGYENAIAAIRARGTTPKGEPAK